MVEIPAICPFNPVQVGVLEDARGDVVGFVMVEFLGPNYGQVVCRKVWDEFSCGARFEVVIEGAAKAAVRMLFGQELELG